MYFILFCLDLGRLLRAYQGTFSLAKCMWCSSSLQQGRLPKGCGFESDKGFDSPNGRARTLWLVNPHLCCDTRNASGGEPSCSFKAQVKLPQGPHVVQILRLLLPSSHMGVWLEKLLNTCGFDLEKRKV